MDDLMCRRVEPDSNSIILRLEESTTSLLMRMDLRASWIWWSVMVPVLNKGEVSYP